jgi:hypothetical protein
MQYLSAKIDGIMAMISNNSGYHIQPFAQNTYGSLFTYALNPTYASGNNILNDLESTIRSFIATQKELKKDFIANFKKMDVLCEMVDNFTKEFTNFKTFFQPQMSHEETMKYLEEVLDKSLKTVRILEARNKEYERLEKLEKEKEEVSNSIKSIGAKTKDLHQQTTHIDNRVS